MDGTLGLELLGPGPGVEEAGERLLKAAARWGLHVLGRAEPGRFSAGLGRGRAWALPDPPHVVFCLEPSVPVGPYAPGTAAQTSEIGRSGPSRTYGSPKSGTGSGIVPAADEPPAARAAVLSAEGPVGRLPGRRTLRVFPMPLEKLCVERASRPLAAAGALAWIAGIGKEVWLSALEEGAERDLGARSYGYAAANLPDLGLAFERGAAEGRMLLSAAAAAGAGAAAAGCRVCAGTGFGKARAWLAARAEALRLVDCPVDDALAAAFAALGAAHCGARAMAELPAGEAGALREAAAWASRAEVPAVFLCGGDGPALSLLASDAQHAPKAVLAPSTVEDLRRCMGEAFDWAEAYQCPVCVLADEELLRRWETLDVLGPSRGVDRGLWAGMPGPEEGPFDRYADAPSGVSGRAAPGQAGTLFLADAEGARTGARREAKLQRKHLAMLGSSEGAFSVAGPADAGLTLVAQGSAAGVLRGLLPELNALCEKKARVLSVRRLLPFPAAGVAEALKGSREALVVETHEEDPLRWLIQKETGYGLRPLSLRSVGRLETVIAAAREVLHG